MAATLDVDDEDLRMKIEAVAGATLKAFEEMGMAFPTAIAFVGQGMASHTHIIHIDGHPNDCLPQIRAISKKINARAMLFVSEALKREGRTLEEAEADERKEVLHYIVETERVRIAGYAPIVRHGEKATAGPIQWERVHEGREGAMLHSHARSSVN